MIVTFCLELTPSSCICLQTVYLDLVGSRGKACVAQFFPLGCRILSPQLPGMYSLEDRLLDEWIFTLSNGKQCSVRLMRPGYNMSGIEPCVNATLPVSNFETQIWSGEELYLSLQMTARPTSFYLLHLLPIKPVFLDLDPISGKSYP
jgi:hypothetical protein